MQYSRLRNVSTDVLLLQITSLAWLIAKIMSFKLWTADRLFPVISVFDFLTCPNWFHLFIYGFSLILVSSLLIFPSKKIVLFVLLAEILSCLLDQMRWQPWQYQYLLTFAFFYFSKDYKQFLSLFVLLLGATYFFSGVHKFSGGFLHTFWDKVVLRKILNLEWATIKNPILHYSGLLLSLLEIAIGIGIVYVRKKKLLLVLAILMHLVIILIFGPFGLNYNLIIFPWNVALIGFAVILIFKNHTVTYNSNFFRKRFNIVILILVTILPFLNFIGKWDNYLSFNLYSGNTPVLLICSSGFQQYPKLTHYQSKTISKFCDNSPSINTNKWALEELLVPVIPEVRVFKKLQNEFQKKYPKVDNTFLYYQYPYKKENISIIE